MPSHHLVPSTSPSSLPPRVLRSLWWSRNSQCSHLWPRPCTPAHATGCTRVLKGGIRTKSSQVCLMRWSRMNLKDRGSASDFTGKGQQIQMCSLLLWLWHEPKAEFTVGYFITDFIDLDQDMCTFSEQFICQQFWCHIRKLCKNCVNKSVDTFQLKLFVLLFSQFFFHENKKSTRNGAFIQTHWYLHEMSR